MSVMNKAASKVEPRNDLREGGNAEAWEERMSSALKIDVVL